MQSAFVGDLDLAADRRQALASPPTARCRTRVDMVLQLPGKLFLNISPESLLERDIRLHPIDDTMLISYVLEGVPGFESIPSTWFPNKLADAFGKLPGVTSRTITDDDADNNHGVLIVQAKTDPVN